MPAHVTKPQAYVFATGREPLLGALTVEAGGHKAKALLAGAQRALRKGKGEVRSHTQARSQARAQPSC